MPSQHVSFSGTRTALAFQDAIACTEAESDGPSNMPHPARRRTPSPSDPHPASAPDARPRPPADCLARARSAALAAAAVAASWSSRRQKRRAEPAMGAEAASYGETIRGATGVEEEPRSHLVRSFEAYFGFTLKSMGTSTRTRTALPFTRAGVNRA